VGQEEIAATIDAIGGKRFLHPVPWLLVSQWPDVIFFLVVGRYMMVIARRPASAYLTGREPRVAPQMCFAPVGRHSPLGSYSLLLWLVETFVYEPRERGKENED